MITKAIKKYNALDADFKHVVKRSGGVFGVRIFGAGIAFAVNIYLARLLGADGFGLFSLALTVVSILALISRFGLDVVVLRDVAKDKNAAQNGHARSIVKPVIRLVYFLSVGLVALLVLASPWIASWVFDKPQLAPILAVMAPLLLFLSVGNIFGDALKAIHHTKVGIFIQNAGLPLVFILAVFGISQMRVLDTVEAALLYSGAALAVLILAHYYWSKVTYISAEAIGGHAGSLIKKGLPLMLMASGSMLLVWTDVIVLGIFETEANVGIYTAASKVAMVTSLILVAVNAIVAPKFSQLHASGNIAGLKALANQVTKLMILLVTVPTVFFIVWPESILGIFGTGFEMGAQALIVLTIGQFINVACGSVGYMLVMTGNEIIMRNIMLGTAAVNALLSIALVSPLGMLGVAIATAISTMLWNFLALYWVRKKVGFWMVG